MFHQAPLKDLDPWLFFYSLQTCFGNTQFYIGMRQVFFPSNLFIKIMRKNLTSIEKHKIQEILKQIQNNSNSGPFMDPVDFV